MNRSYDSSTNTYESRQASKLLKHIESNSYKLVLDLHTTTCSQPACFIAYNLEESVGRFISVSHINKIVQMPEAIALSSLIGNCSQAMSIEISNSDLGDNVYESLSASIIRFLNDDNTKHTKQLYKVTGKIMKVDAPGNLENFEQSAAGYIPVLVGENSYKTQTNYLGFKAKNVTNIKL